MNLYSFVRKNVAIPKNRASKDQTAFVNDNAMQLLRFGGVLLVLAPGDVMCVRSLEEMPAEV